MISFFNFSFFVNDLKYIINILFSCRPELCYNDFKQKLERGGAAIKKILILTLIFLIIFVLAFHFKEEILINNSVQIFIIDSKINRNFLDSPALKIQPDSSHGSKIAGVIRSQSRTDIKAFSATNITGNIDKENYLAALREIKNYADLHPEEKIIVNISLGFEKSEFQQEIIRSFNNLDNLVLVAAAGNNNSKQISYPAKFKNVIAVAALEKEEKMTGSNYGQEIDFAASGIIEITQRHHLPAFNFSRTYKLSGTSFAAPQVTALIADLLSLNSELSIEKALTIIGDTAEKIEDPLFNSSQLGAGSINRFKALSKANPRYLWLQLAIYSSLILAAVFLLYFCWQKYSFSGIFIFLIISSLSFLMQPILLLLYYRFGLRNITVFVLSIILLSSIFLKILKVFIKNSSNFKLLFKIAPYLNNKLQKQLTQRIRKVLAQNNKKLNEKLHKIIINNLAKSYSQKKIKFYLLLAAALERPPVELIVNKSLNYNLKTKDLTAAFNLNKRNKNKKAVLIAELLAVIFRKKYSEKKKAAKITIELNSALVLIPIKNTLKKRNQLQLNDSILYFLLDITGSFAEKAPDFYPLLKEIITQENNPWLKYHAFQAYLAVGVKDSDYQEFIKEIKAKEKEPVLLALKNTIM